MFYGSFGAKRPHEALVRLIRVSLDRTTQNPPPETTSRIQFPVAVLFARGDRGGEGDKLVQQAVSSFYYWNDDSGDSIDFIYAGWSENEGQLIFDRKDFLAFRAAFEDMRRKWGQAQFRIHEMPNERPKSERTPSGFELVCRVRGWRASPWAER